MLSFRQKILFAYLFVFVFFVLLIFPFSSEMVRRIALKAMEDRASEIIANLASATTDEALIYRLKEQKSLVFFRISIITNEKKVLYDSHAKRVLGPRFSQEYVVEHPEVLEAFEKGKGYREGYSAILSQDFIYLAQAFDFHGKTYVLRTAFPYKYFRDFTKDFEIALLGIGILVLGLFSLLTWFIINHFTRPIQQIVQAISPYQKGEILSIPEIQLSGLKDTDDFYRLANTLNSLSSMVQKQIDRLTNEHNEKEAILGSLTEGVIAIGKDLTISYGNQAAIVLLEAISGNKYNGLIGKAMSAISIPSCLDVLKEALEKQALVQNTLSINREGNKISLELLGAPIKGGGGAVLVIQDQSSQFRLMEMRREFVANASHELKTPITIIRGYAETLYEHPELPEKTVQEITSKMVKNCVRMSNLIKDLLALSDVENLPLSRLLPCDLVDVVKRCKYLLLDLYPDAQINIETTQEIVVDADPHLMDLAFMNLIENAAKYSQQPAKITIRFTHLADFVKVEVIDNGMGIPPSDLEFIFQRFYTVNKAHSQKMGGSGLGLSIVQTIVYKHFGKISVQSTLGAGTTFTIILPVALNK